MLIAAAGLNLIQPLDDVVEVWAQQHVTPFRTSLMLTLTQLASTPVVLATTAVLAAVFGLLKWRYWLGRLGLTVPGCMLFNELLKYLFHRSRPVLPHPILTLETYSFPSGHAVAATVFYGFLALFVASFVASKVWRMLIGVIAAALILAIGFSRVYLGVHYPTDVLAGMIEGIVWLSISRMVTRRHGKVATDED